MFFGRRLASLVTCIVIRERDDEPWTVTWASDGRTPPDFSDVSLTGATERAANEIALLYTGKKEAGKAELQFVIYPWPGNPGAVILDISGAPGRFEARDIQGTEISFEAESLEGLVAAAQRFVPDISKAMFRWIRRVSDLAGTGP